MRPLLWPLALAAALVVAGCGGSSTAELSALTATPAGHRCDDRPGSITDLRDGGWRSASGRRWTTTDGCFVRNDVVADVDGHEHCGFQSSRFIVTGEPVGSPARRRGEGRVHVRDPEDVLRDPEMAAKLDLDAGLPGAATDTGFRLGSTQLWAVPGDPEWIYLRGAESVERWPLDREPTFCA